MSGKTFSAAVIIALIAPATARAGDWTFYRHDLAGTGNAGESLTTDQGRALRVTRTATIDGVMVSQPIVAAGGLYFLDGDYLYAMNLSDMSVRWKKRLSVSAPFPACVTIGSQSPIGAPAVIGSTVYAPGADGVVYAYDASTGNQIWATSVVDVHATGGFLWTSIFPVNGKIYVGVAAIIDCTLVPGQVVALNESTGAITGTWWADSQHRDGGGVWTSPAYDPVSNRLFVTTGTIGMNLTSADQPWADAFVAISPDTMQTVDSLSPLANDNFYADQDFGASPTLYDSADGTTHYIAAADKNGVVYALDRDHMSNGVVWTYTVSSGGAEPDKGESTIVSAPYAGGMLYVAGGHTVDGKYPGTIAGLDAYTGAQQWIFHPAGFVLPGMTVAGDVLFAGSADANTLRGKLYALDRHTGAELYELDTAAIFGAPAFANGALYVGDLTGAIYEIKPNPAGVQPDFDIQFPALFGSMVTGTTGSFTATVVPKNGFTGDVTFSAVQLPTHSTVAFSPATVSVGSGSNTTSFQVTEEDAGALEDLAIVSASGGGLTRTAGIWVVVKDFALSATDAGTVQEGSSATSTVTISSDSGFHGAVTLGAANLPAGVTASFDTNPATTGATMTLATSLSTPPGTYSIDVTGTVGTLTRHATASLTVTQSADFTLQIRNPNANGFAGATVTYEIAIAQSASFTAPVTFSVTGLPTGATASFAPGPSAGLEELTISLGSGTAEGPWSLSVIASGGGLTRTAPALLTVLAQPAFSLSTGAPSVTVAAGGTTTVAISVAVNGTLADPIALSMQGLPAGVTATLSPLSSSNTSTLTLTAASSAAAGTYSASVVAASGPVSRSAPLSVQVTAAQPSGSHSSGGCSSTGAPGAAAIAFGLLLALRERKRRTHSKTAA